jgi:hypothetical protein
MTTKRDHTLKFELPRLPRLATRREAADYCRLSVQSFSQWVRMGRLPGPIVGTTRWDLRAIDAAIDSLSELTIADHTSPFDQWKTRHARSSQGNSSRS